MNKLLSFLRWLFFAILVAGLLALLAYVVYPLSYSMRTCLRKCRNSPSKIKRAIALPLWLFLDDEDYRVQNHDYGPDWWRTAKGLKMETKWQRFKAAYLWAVVRNPAWNHYQVIKPREGIIEVVSSNIPLILHEELHPLDFAVLKWVDKDGNYSDNKGEFISMDFSKLGKVFTWYKCSGRLYFRTSYAGYVYWMNRWVEMQAGTNDRRYTVRFKIKKAEIYVKKMYRHIPTGKIGIKTIEYKLTGRELTMQIEELNGKFYFAPKHEFELVSKP